MRNNFKGKESKRKKAKNNNHVREKIRQTLNENSNFYKEKEYWCLKLC